MPYRQSGLSDFWPGFAFLCMNKSLGAKALACKVANKVSRRLSPNRMLVGQDRCWIALTYGFGFGCSLS